MEKSRVKNPFTMGPAPGRRQYQPDLTSHVPARGSFNKGISDGAYIADMLVNFAGVAGGEYSKRVAKKVEADKIAQTTRAANFEKPSDDATMAGYRAHSKMVAERETAKEQAALTLYAETHNPSDEEWNERVKQGYINVDKYMTDNYDQYAKDNDMQKAASVQYREMARAASLGRIASSVGVEIEQRMQASSDSLVTLSASGSFKDATSDQVNAHVNEMFRTLQLTSSQKDKVVEDAILKSNSPELIEFSKTFKGDRSTSLYQRSGKVQSQAKKIRSEELAGMALAISDERRVNSTDFINGKMTDEEFNNQNAMLNKKYDGNYMTAGQLQSIRDTKDRHVASQNIIYDLSNSVMNENVSTLHGTTEQKQAGLAHAQAVMNRQAEAKADAQGLEGDERDAFLNNEARKTVAFIADRSVNLGVPVQAWTDSIRHLSTLNEAVLETVDTVTGGTVKQLSPKAKQAVALLDTMDDYTKHKYLDKMGKDGKIVRSMLDGLDLGEPDHVALSKAHSMAMRTKPISHKEIQEAVKGSMGIFNPWTEFNMPKFQRGYMEDMLYKAYAREPNPTSDRAKKGVEAFFTKGFTTLDNKVRVQGSPDEIRSASIGSYSVRGEDGKLISKEATGVGTDYLSLAFEGYTDAMKSTVRHALGDYGLKEIFPVLNHRRGMMQLHTPDGPIPGTEEPITKLEYFLNNRKVSYEKSVQKEFKEMNAADIRNMFEANRQNRGLRKEVKND